MRKQTSDQARRRPSGLAVLVALAMFLLLLPTSVRSQTDSYKLLDNIEDTWVNLHPVPVRPMFMTADSSHLYAVNAQGNTIVHFDATLQPVETFRTLWGPVSIAEYSPPTGGDELLVVSMLSNALVRHSKLTGDVLEIIALPPEPTDILVDQGQHLAFIATSAHDVVVEIDLLNSQAAPREYSVNSRNPMFLSQTPAGEILVAARWSGNNSAVHRHAADAVDQGDFNVSANVLSVLDLADPSVAVAPGLPDEDVFWLNQTTGEAVPVARGVGTLLFAQGVHPTTGEFWQLNTEANNKDPLLQSEPAIQGNFSFNRLTKFQLPSPLGSSVVQPIDGDFTDLDLINPSGTHDAQFSVGTPYALEFAPSGLAFIAGLMTDNVTVLTANGAWLTEWDLPDGCIPRQIEIEPTEQFAAVYCSGTNTVPLYWLISLSPPLIGTMDLGFDPTPEDIREGRKIFFDASNSEHNNVSCATCHDEGRLDLLAWNLGHPSDDKGPMVTQSLTAINRLVPFHWRGEQQRNLLDFNPAFEALLGGAQLDTSPGGEFEKFEKFVLSLENPANPFQNLERLLDDSIQPPILGEDQNPMSSAVAGQVVFDACTVCHALPFGSSSDLVGDGLVFKDARPGRQWFKIPSLLHLPLKGMQPDVDVTVLGKSQKYPRGGVGLAHSGNPRNIFHFLSFFNGGSGAPETSDGTNFVFQADGGMAPAVHGRTLLAGSTLPDSETYVKGYLLDQASPTKRHADVGVFGRTNINGTDRIAAWAYDREMDTFIRDDDVSQPIGFFTNQVATTRDWFVFVGLPVGMARGWAIDFDRDLLGNDLEGLTLAGEDGTYVVDSDGDGWWDGHEHDEGSDPLDANSVPSDMVAPTILDSPVAVQWTTGRVARMTFGTNELTTVHLNLTPVNPAVPQVDLYVDEPKVHHNLLPTELYPGVQDYAGTLTVTDLAGNSTIEQFSLKSGAFSDAAGVTVMGDLDWGPIGIDINNPGNVAFQAVGRVDLKVSGPPRNPADDRRILAQVFLNGQPASTVSTTPNSFCVNGLAYPPPTPFGLPGSPNGPFVISPPTVAGSALLNFSMTGLLPGDEVELAIFAVSMTGTDTPGCDANLSPLSGPVALFVPGNWSLPDTEAQYRKIKYVH